MNLVKTLIMLSIILTGQEALASGLAKVRVDSANPNQSVKALETFYGDVLKVNQMLGMQKPVSLGKIMKAQQIEMKDGSIYYPEEVEFLIKQNPMGTVEKAPHTPD